MNPNRKSPIIPRLDAAFLKAAIESGSNGRAKRALQTLCKHYWAGEMLFPEDRNGLENTILGALNRSNSDEKVRRWSLSALAQLGRCQVSWDAVITSLQRHQAEPHVVSAAIAAAFKLNPTQAHKELVRMDLVSPQFLAISALQTTDPAKVYCERSRINIEEAESTTLKLGLILVGLNRAPPNLFHPRHRNADLVRALGTHQESLVSQYTLWAAAENPELSASDVGIEPLSVESREANIRSYMYRLYASDSEYSKTQHQLIEAGSRDGEIEARLGCAIGIGDTWYYGIEQIILDWVHDEDDIEIQKYLLHHIAKQSNHSRVYWNSATDLFSAYEGSSEMRDVLKAGAATSPLFRELSKIESDDRGLFSKGDTYYMTHNNITNTGNMQGQFAISGNGTAENSGDQSSFSTGNINVDEAVKTIHDAQEELKGADLEPKLRTEALDALDAAKKQPDQEHIGRAVEVLQRCDNAMGTISGMVEKGKKLADYGMILVKAAGLSD